MSWVANVSDINRFNVRDVNRGSFNTYMNVHDSSRILNWLRMTTESELGDGITCRQN